MLHGQQTHTISTKEFAHNISVCPQGNEDIAMHVCKLSTSLNKLKFDKIMF